MSEQSPSCIVNRTQKTGFVVDDDSQSLELRETVVVMLQRMKWMAGEIHECISVTSFFIRYMNVYLSLRFINVYLSRLYKIH